MHLVFKNNLYSSQSRDIIAALWVIFNQTTHTCESTAIEVDERENIRYIFFETLTFFTRKKKQQERKQICNGDL